VSCRDKGGSKDGGEHQRLTMDPAVVMGRPNTPRAKLATCARTAWGRTVAALLRQRRLGGGSGSAVVRKVEGR
jgi:hypothetical protein